VQTTRLGDFYYPIFAMLFLMGKVSPEKEGLSMHHYCWHCGAQLTPGKMFCRSCGARIQAVAPPNTAPHSAQPVPSGERWGKAEHLQQLGLAAYLKAGVGAGLASFRQTLKNPKQLIPMLALGALWLALSILPALGINPLPVQLLSFLTFAQGGMYGGVLGAVGGVMGKAVFAYFVSALLLPLFSGKNPFRGMGGGFKAFFSGLAAQSASAAASLLMGLGLALVLYNFFTGNAGLVSSMAGVFGFILALKSLLSKGGFVWGLLLTAASKFTKGRTPSQEAARHAVSGYAAGSAAGMALSVLSRPYFPLTAYLPYMAGAALLIAGLSLGIAAKSKKKVASA
jgi:hypothetical protein